MVYTCTSVANVARSMTINSGAAQLSDMPERGADGSTRSPPRSRFQNADSPKSAIFTSNDRVRRMFGDFMSPWL